MEGDHGVAIHDTVFAVIVARVVTDVNGPGEIRLSIDP
jgi:hypothetical protein